jgi:hypothetical protein
VDYLDLVAERLKGTGLDAKKGINPSSLRPQLEITQDGRLGWAKAYEHRNIVWFAYYYNGHRRGEFLLEPADPKSFPLMMRFLRTMFRVYGKA